MPRGRSREACVKDGLRLFQGPFSTRSLAASTASDISQVRFGTVIFFSHAVILRGEQGSSDSMGRGCGSKPTG